MANGVYTPTNVVQVCGVMRQFVTDALLALLCMVFATVSTVITDAMSGLPFGMLSAALNIAISLEPRLDRGRDL
jgi:hypothetical protein